jgi:hypothetical protein
MARLGHLIRRRAAERPIAVVAVRCWTGKAGTTVWLPQRTDRIEEDELNEEFAIEIPDSAWQPNDGLDDATARLRVTLTVNGYHLHLEAWKVSYHDDLQVHDAYPDDYDNLHAAVGADGWFGTITIEGSDYILLASPYC